MSVKEVSSPAAKQCSHEADDSHCDPSVREDQSSNDEQTTRDIGAKKSACRFAYHAPRCKCVYNLKEFEEARRRLLEIQREKGGTVCYHVDRGEPNCQLGRSDEGNGDRCSIESLWLGVYEERTRVSRAEGRSQQQQQQTGPSLHNRL